MVAKRRHIPGAKRRLNLKLEEELVEWVKEYADRRKTSVTDLIRDFFLYLKAREDEHLSLDTEQI